MSQFKLYVGAKILRATAQEREGKAGYVVLYPDGYKSWSPKDSFESAYREVSDSEKALACVHESGCPSPLEQASGARKDPG